MPREYHASDAAFKDAFATLTGKRMKESSRHKKWRRITSVEAVEVHLNSTTDSVLGMKIEFEDGGSIERTLCAPILLEE